MKNERIVHKMLYLKFKLYENSRLGLFLTRENVNTFSQLATAFLVLQFFAYTKF